MVVSLLAAVPAAARRSWPHPRTLAGGPTAARWAGPALVGAAFLATAATFAPAPAAAQWVPRHQHWFGHKADPVIELSRSLLQPEDRAALARFEVTPERMMRFEVASRRLEEALRADPAVRQELKLIRQAKDQLTIPETVSAVATRAPAVSEVLRQCGTDPQEYVLTSLSLINASAFVMYRHWKPRAPRPEFVPAENLAFVEQNIGRVEVVLRSFRADADGK